MLKARLESKGIKYLRIVSIGEAKAHSDPRTHGMLVPCQVEMERNGERSVETKTPGVRPVYNQPDRWTIFGGI